MRGLFVWVGKVNLIVWGINVIVFVILVGVTSGWTGLLSSGFFSKAALLETGIAFLAAGAIAFSGSVLPSKAKEYSRKTGEEWSMDRLRRSEKRANKYIVLAIVLFVESLLVSFVGF
jgi:hypothetical protein